MNNQVLSIEQMQELIELNFTPKFIHKFSSMMWVKYPNPYPPAQKENPILTRLVPASGEYYGVEDMNYIPTFTLQDILEMLPNIKGYYYPDLRQVSKSTWQIIYKPKFGELPWIYKNGFTSINAAFNMLKWCKQNNHI